MGTKDLSLLEIPVEYYKLGLMKYHPYYHPNRGKSYTVEELEYLCKFYEIDGANFMGMALGRPPKSIAATVNKLKDEGKFEYYKLLNKFW
ncbi:DNA-entry nuclease [Bacillus sp. SM2101]|uniref:DNA-entry nuclease n=1 Tax=Bacillus sp. SM2101 TaxID=2805366 RepID=UPI001BDDE5EC|nr:DNA-entry nuclease [Bacillus sp. SM2101]